MKKLMSCLAVGVVLGVVALALTACGGTTVSSGPTATGGGDPAASSFAALDRTSGVPDARFPKVHGGNVYAMASDASGGYYIAGSLTKVGSLSRAGVAHILADGSVDPAFSFAANDTVYSLAVSGSTVYAGGDFSAAGR